MPGTDQYVSLPDGSYVHVPGDATSDQLSALRSKLGNGGDPLTQQMQSAARGAGAPAGASPQPLQGQMRAQGQAYEQSLGPQARIEQFGTPQQQERLGSGLDMSVPAAIAGFGATSPIATIAEKGLAGYVAPLVRSGLKSLAGSEIGRYGGRAVGGMFGKGGAETGGEVGGALGAIGGPFVSGETFAKLPFGLGRLVASNEETAAARTAMKLAQRESDIKAGLRSSPLGRIPIDPNSLAVPEDQIASTVARTKGNLVLTPEEARTRARMEPIWEKRASERGMIFAGGGVPEEGRSVPRVPTKTSIEEYGGPREVVPLNLNPPVEEAPLGKIGERGSINLKSMFEPSWVQEAKESLGNTDALDALREKNARYDKIIGEETTKRPPKATNPFI